MKLILFIQLIILFLLIVKGIVDVILSDPPFIDPKSLLICINRAGIVGRLYILNSLDTSRGMRASMYGTCQTVKSMNWLGLCNSRAGSSMYATCQTVKSVNWLGLCNSWAGSSMYGTCQTVKSVNWLELCNNQIGSSKSDSNG